MIPKPHSLPEEDYLNVKLLVAGVRTAGRAPRRIQLAFQILIANESRESVRLKGRKWMIRDASGEVSVVEAENVFNMQPLLKPGEVFSYAGNHVLTAPATHMELRFFGLNRAAMPFISPPFAFPKAALALPPRS